MKSVVLAAGVVAALVGSAVFAPASAKQRTVIDQLPANIVDHNYVDKVEVVVADTAAERMAVLEAKAEQKRVDAGIAATPAPGEAAVPKEQYATLPFAVMMPLVMRDVTRKWGLTREHGNLPVDLRVTIENVKTANAGMALLIASSDELSGEVAVLDPATRQPLGSFYVQVINSHGGLAGLAMRGAGIREKLVEEFALESSRILTGSTKKDWKKRVKASEQPGSGATTTTPAATGA